jgi:hypothetical protein
MNEPHGCFAEYTSKGPYVNVLLDRQRTVFEKSVFPVTFGGTFEIILDLTSSNMFYPAALTVGLGSINVYVRGLLGRPLEMS